MNINKISNNLDKAEDFANEFIAELNNPDQEAAAKTAFFMDKQGDLKKVLDMLQGIATHIKETVGATGGEMSADEEALLARAQGVSAMLKDNIRAYKDKLMVDPSVENADKVKGLTTDNIKEALTINETTKNISNDLAQAAIPTPNCNYAIVADGETIVFEAKSKQDINDCLMQTLQTAKDPNSIALYAISYTPVPLKQKTITVLTV